MRRVLVWLLLFTIVWLPGCSFSGEPKEPKYAGVYVWDFKPFHGWENVGSLQEWTQVYVEREIEGTSWWDGKPFKEMINVGVMGVIIEKPPRVPRKFRILLKSQGGVFLSSCELTVRRAVRIKAGSTYYEKDTVTAYIRGDESLSDPPLEPETSYANAHRIIPEKGSDRIDFEFTKPGAYFILFPSFADDIPFVVEVE